MLIYESDRHRVQGRAIDLNGPQGNGFTLIGIAKQYAQQLDMDPNKIALEMTTGDYIDLVLTFDKHFGYYVDLIVPEGIREELHQRRFKK